MIWLRRLRACCEESRFGTTQTGKKPSTAIKKDRQKEVIQSCKVSFKDAAEDDGPTDHEHRTLDAIFEVPGRLGHDDTFCET